MWAAVFFGLLFANLAKFDLPKKTAKKLGFFFV